MKLYLALVATVLFASNGLKAQERQETQEPAAAKTHSPIDSKEMQIAREKQDAKFAKEQRKLQKRQDKLAKKQRKFEKKNDKIAKAESKLAKERNKRNKYQSKMDRDEANYKKQLARGNMSPEEAAKWEIRKRKNQQNIDKSITRMEDADKKIRSLRN